MTQQFFTQPYDVSLDCFRYSYWNKLTELVNKKGLTNMTNVHVGDYISETFQAEIVTDDNRISIENITEYGVVISVNGDIIRIATELDLTGKPLYESEQIEFSLTDCNVQILVSDIVKQDVTIIRNIPVNKIRNMRDRLFHHDGFYFMGTFIGGLLWGINAYTISGIMFARHDSIEFDYCKWVKNESDNIPLLIVARDKPALYCLKQVTGR